MIKISLSLTLFLFACSSAAPSYPEGAPTCEEACTHGDTLATGDGGTCLASVFSLDTKACADACVVNAASTCMAQAGSCEAWSLCTEHAQTGTGALPPSRVRPYEEVEGCTRPGPPPGQTCPPGVRCCH